MQQRVFGLDLLRALAILSVVLAHTRLLLVARWPWAKSLALGGYWGVELFFVLSGFLIGQILMRMLVGSQDLPWSLLRRFWIRRWFRTLPNYYLFLCLYLVMYSYVVGPNILDWRYFLFAQNLVTPHPGFFGEAWSLAVEEWFYLLVPGAMFPLLRRVPQEARPTRVLVLILGLWVAVFLLRMGYVLLAEPSWDLGTRKIVVFRLDGILTGVLAAWFASFRPALFRRLGRKALGAGVLLLTVGAWQYFALDLDNSLYARTAYFSLTSIGFACLFPCFAFLGNKPIPGLRLVTMISLTSYAMYLIHFSLVLFLVRRWLPMQTASEIVAGIGVYWGLCLVVPLFVYWAFEKPMMDLRERF